MIMDVNLNNKIRRMMNQSQYDFKNVVSSKDPKGSYDREDHVERRADDLGAPRRG